MPRQIKSVPFVGHVLSNLFSSPTLLLVIILCSVLVTVCLLFLPSSLFASLFVSLHFSLSRFFSLSLSLVAVRLPVPALVMSASSAYLSPAKRHEIVVHAPKETAVIIVHLLGAAVVRNDDIVAHVAPLHLRRRLPSADCCQERLAIPRVDRA